MNNMEHLNNQNYEFVGNFKKKTDKTIPVYSVDSIEGLNQMLGALKNG